MPEAHGTRQSRLPSLFDLDLLERFGQNLQSPQPLSLARFWEGVLAEFPALPPDARRTLFGKLVLLDLEDSWRRAGGTLREAAPQSPGPDASGDSAVAVSTVVIPRLEHYAQRHPQLGPAQDLGVSFVAEEYRLRHLYGDRPSHEEYLHRFPHLAPQLPSLLAKVDAKLRAARLPKASPSPPPPSPDAAPGAGAASPAAAGRRGSSSSFPRIPGYEILAKLGHGGMGVVYKARQIALKRDVALKMILGDPKADGDELDRFRREAEAVAQLQHPNIVQIYEVGEHDSHPYFTLELVEGGSLDRKLKGTPLPPRQSASIVETLAEAMHYAHERGVIHRDLKPANILLTSGKVVFKLTDFGLAKRVRDDTKKTMSGMVMGTPSYMPPEQAQGKNAEITHLADVYALGAVLYELLTGRPPFKGTSAFETLLQVISQEPVAPRTLQPQVPRDLETICLKCLQKEPRRRYQSGEELAADLRRFLNHEPIRARPVSTGERVWKWVRRHPAVSVLTSLLVLASVAGISALLWQLGETQTALGKAEAAQESERLAKDSANENANKATLEAQRAEREANAAQRNAYNATATLAHRDYEDANMKAVISRLESLVETTPGRDLRSFEWYRLWELSHREQRILQGHTDAVKCVACSPDGKTIATGSFDQTIKLWDAGSGQLTQTIQASMNCYEDIGIGYTPCISCLAFSPDGKLLAYGGYNPYHGYEAGGLRAPGMVKVFDLRKGQEIAILTGHEEWVKSVAFGADSQTIAVGSEIHSAGNPMKNVLKLWKLGSQPEGKVLPLKDTGDVKAVAFSPSGTTLAVVVSNRTVLWDVASGTEGATLEGHGEAGNCLAFSPTQKLLATGGRDGTIVLWDPETLKPTGSLTGHKTAVTQVAFSPDGTFLASASDGGIEHRNHEIKVWHLSSRTCRHTLRGHTEDVTGVTFLRDGVRLVSTSKDRTARIWDLAVPGRPDFLDGKAPEPLCASALSPNGSLLACAMGGYQQVAMALRPSGIQLWDVRTGQLRATLQGHTAWVTAVAFSPDGTLLASASQDQTIRLWNIPEGTSRATLNPYEDKELPRRVWPVSIAFSPDGTMLAFGSANSLWPTLGGDVRLWEIQGNKEPSNLTGREKAVWAITFSRDGNSLVWGDEDGAIHFWDARSQEERLVRTEHTKRVTSLTYGDGGRLLVSTSDDASVNLWDAKTEEIRRVLVGHTGSAWSAAFCPDGKTLATGGGDHTVRIWDLLTGQERAAFVSEQRDAYSLAFTQDGTALMVVGDSKVVTVWQAPRTVQAAGGGR